MPKEKHTPQQTKENQRVKERQDVESRTESQRGAETDMSRLLHEAAWARMFGKLEAKNPFER
jgi:hypothetical protein